MEILYIANALIPSGRAHPYQIMKTCEAFTKNKARVTLVLPLRVKTRKKPKQAENYWNYYGIETRFGVVKVPSFDLVWLDLFVGRFTWHSCFLLQAISFALFATFYSLFKKADVYYTRERYFAFLFGCLKFWHKKEVYYEAHSIGSLERWLVKKGVVDGLIVITYTLKDIYVRQGIPEGQIFVAPDGVDLKVFAHSYPKEKARNELGIPLDEKVICYAGHLFDWKGAHVLARSMNHLSSEHVAYFIGGMERNLRRFKGFINKNKIPNVVLTGQVPPTVVPKYLAAADVVVLPNLKTRASEYTSPLKMFEYMAAKRPIIASDLASLREVLNEGNAIFVEPDNPEALAHGIREVLENSELATKITETAYQEVEQYTWDKRAAKILEFIVRKRSMKG